jgi:hypothetical protein
MYTHKSTIEELKFNLNFRTEVYIHNIYIYIEYFSFSFSKQMTFNLKLLE